MPLLPADRCEVALRPGLSCLESPGEQADVPAEQPSAGEDAPVPAADAHARRPRHSRPAPRQRPLAAARLTARASVLRAAARMRRRAAFPDPARPGRRPATPSVVLLLDPAPA